MTTSSRKKVSQRTIESFFILFFAAFLCFTPSYGKVEGEPTELSPLRTITITNQVVTEGETARMPVRIDDCPTKFPVKIKYETKNRNAAAGSDYTAKSGTITFAANENCNKEVIIEFQTNDDEDVEVTEEFTVEFADNETSQYQPFNFTHTHFVTINDNDIAKSYSVQVSKYAYDGTQYQASYATGFLLDNLVEYKIVAKNTGDPTTLTIEDALPVGLTPQSVSISGTAPSNFGCTINQNKTLCQGAHEFDKNEEVTIKVIAKIEAKGLFWSGVTAKTESGNSASDGVTIDVESENLLSSHTKTVSPPENGEYNQDDTVTYTLTATNTEGPARVIRITDNLGYYQTNAFEYIDSSSSTMDCTLTGTLLTCNSNDPVPSGSTVTVKVKVKLKKTGNICNLARFYTKENDIYGYAGYNKKCIDVIYLADFRAYDKYYTIIKGNQLSRQIKTVSGVKLVSLDYDGPTSTLNDGKIHMNEDTSFTYQEDDSTGYIRYRYTIEDSLGRKASAWLKITVEEDPLEAHANYYNLGLTQTRDGNVLSNDIGTELKVVSVVYDDENSTFDDTLVVNEDGSFSYNGSDIPGILKYNYTIEDTYGRQSSSILKIRVSGPWLDVKYNSYYIKRGEVLTGNFLTDDGGYFPKVIGVVYDADYSDLPDNGLFDWNEDGSFTYVQNESNGRIRFKYAAQNSSPEYTRYTYVIIHVTSVTIAAKADVFNIVKDTLFAGNLFSDNGNGEDRGEEISIAANTAPLHGNLVISENGEFTYNPQAGYTGSDTFTYMLRDKFGDEANATVIINVGNDKVESFTDFYLVNPLATRNIIGNYATTGNTVTCVTEQEGTQSSGSYSFTAPCSNNPDTNNNNKLVRYVDIDQDSSTWNSSSGQIILPESYDQDGSGILWAGLFWQAAVSNHSRTSVEQYVQRRAKSSGTGITYDYIYGENKTLDIQDISTIVKMKIGENSYTDITAETFYYNTLSNNTAATYAAYTDVTELFKNANLAKGEHTITVANITANEGRDSATGNYGGWSLVVIYKDDPEDISAKARNISIYNGFAGIGPGGEGTEKVITVDGFKLPKEKDVNANITIFSGEGESAYGGHADVYDKINIVHNNEILPMPSDTPNNIFNSKLDGITRNSMGNNNLTNNNGIDIDNYDVSNILTALRDEDKDINSLDIKITSKDTDPDDDDYSDYVTPSMIAFSAELHTPNICYNYTLDIDGFVLDSTNNKIVIPPLFSTEKSLTTHFSILSKEGDFVLRDTNITYKINDTTRLHYTTDSVAIAKNEVSNYQNAGSNGLDQAYEQTHAGLGLYIGDDVGANGQPGGSIDSHQMRYIRFDDKIIDSGIDTSFNFKLDYLINYGSGPLAVTKYFNNASLCPLPAGYKSARGRFNVTSSRADNATGKPFNLYTQVTNRPFDIKVFSHDDNLTGLINRHLTVELEPFNANFYSHDAEISCQDIDTSITDSQFLYFNHTNRVDLNNQKYDFAMRNIGFRIWHLVDDANLLVNHQCANADDNTCFAQLYTDTYRDTDTYCQTECNSGTGCYTCLRKYYGRASCSQDNFSIRPNAFSSLIKDSNQTDTLNNTTTPNNISDSHSPSDLGLSANASIIAGYKYRFDINATNYDDEQATPRYVGPFDGTYNVNRYIQFKWDGKSAANCDNTDDIDIPLPLLDGSSVMPALNYAYIQSIANLGEYELRIFDQNWTAVDWAETTHHLHNPEWDIVAEDCVKDNPSTLDYPITGTTIRNGCAISNIHADTKNTYVAPKLHTYPYSFNLSQLHIGAGPNNNKDYVFMDTLDSSNDYDMSYNIKGILQAEAYPDGSLANFTNTCYAADINISLGTSYLSPVPDAQEDANFRYNLLNSALDNTPMGERRDELFTKVYADINDEQALIVEQDKEVFTPEMAGSINMDLGYNFDRTYDNPINPRRIHFSNLNVNYTNPPSNLYFEYRDDYTVEAQRKIDSNVTFIYGRVKPTQNFYDNVTEASIITPLAITAYCDDTTIVCKNTYNIDVIADNSTRSNEHFWWFVENYATADGDGNVALSTPTTGASISPVNPIPFTQGVTSNLSISYTGTRPFTVRIRMLADETLANFTHRWLIYNSSDDSVPNTFYRVRFIDSAGWTGEGTTGHVVDGDINKKKNRKMEW